LQWFVYISGGVPIPHIFISNMEHEPPPAPSEVWKAILASGQYGKSIINDKGTKQSNIREEEKREGTKEPE